MQAPAAVQTPLWGGSSNGPGAGKDDSPSKDAAAPKTWKGVGEWQVHCLQCCSALDALSPIARAFVPVLLSL